MSQAPHLSISSLKRAGVGLLLWAASSLVMAADPEPAMKVEQVGPHSYYVQGLSQLGSTKNQNFISNAGFVITPQSVVVIDALGSPRLAERLTAEIRKLTPLPISDVILTHYHADHIYGLQYFKQLGARITAHVAAKEYIQSDTASLRLEASRTDLAPWIDDKTRLVLADTWINGPTSLKIGGWVFEIDHVGPSHTPEDLTVFVPNEKVLFAGDLFFNGRLPFVGKANSSQWILSLDQMLKHDATAVVPGHGAASMDPKKDITMTRDYLKYLRTSMGAAVQDFVPFEEAYKATDWSAFEATPMFGFANRMNAYNTYLLMEEEALEKKR
ncbi:MBL fold metallo-hydrolase [Hydrogenophaga sp.]|uniref:MBL fold metallo-hydrolase n=1 Tax=Hydrogenophaga sp. TaxID=1904254 RepID=UPI0025C1B273|nr:MBL fold metallo-hydrolase [Hydrogenophaga sp.]